MEVSWHADEGLVIVSLWHGSICRATFRLPVDQAPALIQTLADALGNAVPSTPPPPRRLGPPRCSKGDATTCASTWPRSSSSRGTEVAVAHRLVVAWTAWREGY